MKIIILAAGRGSRLMPLTKNMPKSLLRLKNKKTLLDFQIEAIRRSHVIGEVVLVIGYLAHKIERKIESFNYRNLKIQTIYNPFFYCTNNLVSLWFARQVMNDDFLITNGDNIFKPNVFVKFVNENKNGIYLSANIKNYYDDDDMKVTIKNNLVKYVSKKIPAKRANAESPGLVLVHGKKYVKIFRENLELLVRNKEYHNKFWLEVFNILAKKQIAVHPWRFNGNTDWQEIDFHADLDKVKEIIRPKFFI